MKKSWQFYINMSIPAIFIITISLSFLNFDLLASILSSDSKTNTHNSPSGFHSFFTSNNKHQSEIEVTYKKPPVVTNEGKSDTSNIVDRIGTRREATDYESYNKTIKWHFKKGSDFRVNIDQSLAEQTKWRVRWEIKTKIEIKDNAIENTSILEMANMIKEILKYKTSGMTSVYLCKGIGILLITEENVQQKVCTKV
jgi:predicted porin